MSTNKIFVSKKYYVPALLFIAGIIVGILGTKHIFPDPNSAQDSLGETRSGGFKLINPLLECNANESYGVKEFSDLEESLNSYIEKDIKDTSVNHVSVYFRDLNNGPWFGINERDVFAPSSLLKLPVMMAYYKKAESDPSLLSRKVKYETDREGLISQNFNTTSPLKKGQEYTVEELIEHMIQGSDNKALGLLTNGDLVTDEEIDRVTLDLGLPTADDLTPNDFMSVKQYSSLFRVLFNASYLDNKYSQKALGILSKSEFDIGITKPLPKNIIIAHKFGERHIPNGDNQLHDCGIVYYPNRPFLVCIMTKGTDFNELATTIQHVSQQIYYEFENRYNQK